MKLQPDYCWLRMGEAGLPFARFLLLVGLAFMALPPARAEVGADIARMQTILAGVERVAEVLSPSKRDEASEIDFVPLRRLLTVPLNAAAFDDALQKATKETATAPPAEKVARARLALRSFLRGRAYAVDARFCVALGLNLARCEELACLVYGVASNKTDGAACQASAAELGSGPTSPETLKELINTRRNTPAWAAYVTASGYGQGIPLVEEAASVRSALDVLASRLVAVRREFPDAAPALLLDRTIGAYRHAKQQLRIAQSALATVLEDSDFGQTARGEIARTLGPALIDLWTKRLSELTASDLAFDDPINHAGVVELVTATLREMADARGAIRKLEEQLRQKLAEAEASAKKILKTATDEVCESNGSIIFVSPQRGVGAIALLVSGSGDTREAELVVNIRPENLPPPAHAQVLDKNGKPGPLVAAICAVQVTKLGIRVRVQPDASGTGFRIAPLDGRGVLGLDGATFELAVKESILGLTPFPAIFAFSAGNIRIDKPDLTEVSVDLDIRLPSAELVINRKFKLISGGKIDATAIQAALLDTSALKEVFAKALNSSVERQTIRLFPGARIDTLRLLDISTVAIDSPPANARFSGRLLIDGLDPVAMEFEVSADGLRLTPKGDISGPLAAALARLVPADAIVNVANAVFAADAKLNAADGQALGGRLSWRALRLDVTANALVGEVGVALAPGRFERAEFKLRPGNLAKDASEALSNLIKKVAADTANRKLFVGIFGEQIAASLEMMRKIRGDLSRPRELFGLTLTPELPENIQPPAKFSLLVTPTGKSNPAVKINGITVARLQPSVVVNYDGVTIGDTDRVILARLVADAIVGALPPPLIAFVKAEANDVAGACGLPKVAVAGFAIAVTASIKLPLIGCTQLPPVHLGIDELKVDAKAIAQTVTDRVVTELKSIVRERLPPGIAEYFQDVEFIFRDRFVAVVTIRSDYLVGKLDVSLPDFRVGEFKFDKNSILTGALMKYLRDTLGAAGGDGPLNIKELRQLPGQLALQFGLDIKLSDIFSVTMNDIRLSAKGVKLTSVGFAFPGVLAAGPVIITQPGLRIDFGERPAYALSGNMSFLGLEPIYRLRAQIEALIKEKQVRLSGDSYVLQFLQIFKDRGLVDFRQSSLRLTSESTGVLKALMPYENETVVDGDAKAVTWRSDASLLGVKFNGKGELVFGGGTPQVSLAAAVNLGSLGVKGTASSDIYLRRPKAALDGALPVIVGTADVHIEANHTYARAQVNVSRLKLGVTVPTLSMLSGEMLKALVERLLKPTISLDALKKLLELQIEISFLPAGKGSEFQPPEPPGKDQPQPPPGGGPPPLPSAPPAADSGSGKRPPPPPRIAEAPWQRPGDWEAWAGYARTAEGLGCWTDYWRVGKNLTVDMSPYPRSANIVERHLDALRNWRSTTLLEGPAVVPHERQRRKDCGEPTGVEPNSSMMVIVDWANKVIHYAIDAHDGGFAVFLNGYAWMKGASPSFATVEVSAPTNDMRSLSIGDRDVLLRLTSLQAAGRAVTKVTPFAAKTSTTAFIIAAAPGTDAPPAVLLMFSEKPSIFFESGSRIANTIRGLLDAGAPAAMAREEVASFLNGTAQLVLATRPETTDRLVLLSNRHEVLAIDERSFEAKRVRMERGRLDGVRMTAPGVAADGPRGQMLATLAKEIIGKDWTDLSSGEVSGDSVIVLSKLPDAAAPSMVFVTEREPVCFRRTGNEALVVAVKNRAAPTFDVDQAAKTRPLPFRNDLIDSILGGPSVWFEKRFQANPRGAFTLCSG